MSQAELSEHQAKECLQAAGRSEAPLKREMPLTLALDWTADAIAALKQPALIRVTPRNYHRRFARHADEALQEKIS